MYVCMWVCVYLAQQDFRVNDLCVEIENMEKKKCTQTVSNAEPSRKWMKRNRKMMMKIFFLNSFFFQPFKYTVYFFSIIECTEISLVWKIRAILNGPWNKRTFIVRDRERVYVENRCAERSAEKFDCVKNTSTNVDAKSCSYNTTYDNAGNHSLN